MRFHVHLSGHDGFAAGSFENCSHATDAAEATQDRFRPHVEKWSNLR